MVSTFSTKGPLVSSRTSFGAGSVDIVALGLFETITTALWTVNPVLSSLTLWIYWNNVMCAKHFNTKFILYSNDTWISKFERNIKHEIHTLLTLLTFVPRFTHLTCARFFVTVLTIYIRARQGSIRSITSGSRTSFEKKCFFLNIIVMDIYKIWHVCNGDICRFNNTRQTCARRMTPSKHHHAF